MALQSKHDAVRTQLIIKGRFFGARGSSCDCDPCDCNPCRCGDADLLNPPLWRVSGVVIDDGMVDDIDLSHLILLSSSLPHEEETRSTWEEFFLVDHRTTPEQITGLLTLFEEELASLPAEVEPLPRLKRAVYRTPIDYFPDEKRPHLRVNTAREWVTLVRTGEGFEHTFPREWAYDGPMAVRGVIDRHISTAEG